MILSKKPVNLRILVICQNCAGCASDSRSVICIKALNMDGIMMFLQMESIGTVRNPSYHARDGVESLKIRGNPCSPYVPIIGPEAKNPICSFNFRHFAGSNDSVRDSRSVVCIKTLNMDGIMMFLQMESIGTA